MAERPQPLQPPTPPQPRPPLGQEAPSLGKDVPGDAALARLPVVRAGAIVMAALWEE